MPTEARLKREKEKKVAEAAKGCASVKSFFQPKRNQEENENAVCGSSVIENESLSFPSVPHSPTKESIDSSTENSESSDEESDIDDIDIVVPSTKDNESNKVFQHDNRLFDERKYLNTYTWAYYSLINFGYMCKICEVFYNDKPCPSGRGRGAWSHNAVLLKKNPKKRFQRHEKSHKHSQAVLLKTNARIEDALSVADRKTLEEKKNSNELYITKLIKTVHFLASNNLTVKELYPKIITFLAEDIKEPVIKQYLETCKKNTTYQSSSSCDTFLVSLNTYFIDQVKRRAIKASDIVLFADEATSAARKEMIAIYISYFDETTKSFFLDFLTLTSIQSTKSEIIMEKIKEILSQQEIDISKTRFVCFDGTNSMSGEKSGVQRRYRNDAPFSIYVNCRCHRLALCFKHLISKFSWLAEIDGLLLGLWKTFHYSSLNRHIFTELQQTYGLIPRHIVKAAVTRWLSHGQACKRVRERYEHIVIALDEIISQNKNPEWQGYRCALLKTTTVFQITFLEDLLAVTNVLCLLLQSDQKDFAAVSRAVQSTISILSDMQNNINSNHLANFHKCNDIINKLSDIEMRTTVSESTRKKK